MKGCQFAIEAPKTFFSKFYQSLVKRLQSKIFHLLSVEIIDLF